jgi:hypothetical protein
MMQNKILNAKIFNVPPDEVNLIKNALFITSCLLDHPLFQTHKITTHSI